MRDHFEGHSNSSGGRPARGRSSGTLDWARLEEVGDLHFHASAFSTALDYYDRINDDATLSRLELVPALRVLRKSVDANLLLGNLDQLDILLERVFARLDRHAEGPEAELALIQRAVFQCRQADALRQRGRLQDALQLAKRAFSVLALTDEHTDVAILQVVMGICHARLGRLEKAEEFFNDGLATFRRIDHELGVANVLNNLAHLHKLGCRWERALSLLDKAVDLARKIGASHLLPGFYLNQGLVLLKIDRLGEARTLLDKGLRLAASLGDRANQTRLHLAMGRLETLSGRLARAEELILEGRTLAEDGRFLREATIADEYLGDILLARGDVEKARYNYELGLQKSRRISAGNDLETELQRRMGEVHLVAGRLDEAIAVSQAAIAVGRECGETYELGFCHGTLGRAYAGQGDRKLADDHFREAIATFGQQQLTHLWCRTILAFADVRRSDAGEAELLLLRRYLMDAQENGAAAVGDRMLCEILDRLARVQIRLGQFDDALLTVFELERHAAGLEDAELARGRGGAARPHRGGPARWRTDRRDAPAGHQRTARTVQPGRRLGAPQPGLGAGRGHGQGAGRIRLHRHGRRPRRGAAHLRARGADGQPGAAVDPLVRRRTGLGAPLRHGLLLAHRHGRRPGPGRAGAGGEHRQLRLHAHRRCTSGASACSSWARGDGGRRRRLRPGGPGLPGHLHGFPGPVPLREGARRPRRPRRPSSASRASRTSSPATGRCWTCWGWRARSRPAT